MVYIGDFRENVRHGNGTIILNGITIYEGDWFMDQLSGEGYIKSLKLMSNSCPSHLLEASFCGHIFENRFHGMGTLFLNQR
jgi:hypothetical protein